MFNIYGVSPIILAVGMLTTRPVIFFEMLGIVILNILCNMAVIHCFMRNALLSGVECVAKSREEALRMKEKERNEFFEMLREKNRKIEEKRRAKEERERRKLKEKEEEKRRQREKEEEKKKLKEKEKVQKEAKKEEKETKDVKIPETEKPMPKPPEEPKEKKSEVKKEEEKSDIEKENEELRKKIKEQKKILRKKLETIRRNAFITRKPEEIEKAEKLIKDILTKHNLTEDMLKDDEE
jgi:hypothetical protein